LAAEKRVKITGVIAGGVTLFIRLFIYILLYIETYANDTSIVETILLWVPMSKDVTCHPNSQSQFRHLGSVVPDLAHYGLDVILCCQDVRSHGACAILRHPVTIPAKKKSEEIKIKLGSLTSTTSFKSFMCQNWRYQGMPRVTNKTQVQLGVLIQSSLRFCLRLGFLIVDDHPLGARVGHGLHGSGSSTDGRLGGHGGRFWGQLADDSR
jgi:hypothetical protein